MYYICKCAHAQNKTIVPSVKTAVGFDCLCGYQFIQILYVLKFKQIWLKTMRKRQHGHAVVSTES